MKKTLVILLFLLGAVFTPKVILAQESHYQEEILEARVEKIIREGKVEGQLFQELELLVTKGSLAGEKIMVENGNLPMSYVTQYKAGDEVVLSYSQDHEGNDSFAITDFVRRKPLLWLFGLFLLMTIVIGRFQGLSSLAGMAVSFLVIFKFILPKISQGLNPVMVAILGSLLIIPPTFILSHGINKKTFVSIVGTAIALVITGFLASFFVTIAKLSGFATEEAAFLQVANPGLINMQGLLLAGIIIGVLGVLDDITISQAAIVKQLREANPQLKAVELYQKAMSVGKDHIASMVNTLVLVYTGAALPLMLLFVGSPRPFSEVVNYEIIAAEIVRTLVGSIGLILAVPITTLLAAWVTKKSL